MRATAEAIEGNRVKLSVEVPEDELAEAVEQTVRRLVRDARVPGFRPGKVPRRLLEQRLGAKAIREEVIREVLPDYYQQAVDETELDAITPPEIDITAGEESGPLTFDAVLEVRPRVQIAGYRGLVVTVPSPQASEEDVDAQIDRLRDQFGVLSDVGRAAREGDHVTLGVQGMRDGEPVDGLTADDLVYEVGSNTLAQGADEQLRGAKAGDVLKVDAPDVTGGPATVQIIVKQVREKILPEANDEWASDASEFETLEELRSDIRQRISVLKQIQARLALRDGAIEALVELVTDDPPRVLVGEELERRLRALDKQLHSRRISLEQYLEATGQTQEGLIASEEAHAAHAVKADLALRAIADEEEIEVSDAEMEAEIERVAKEMGRSATEIRERLEGADGLAEIRSDIRKSKAVTWLVEHVGVVDDQGHPADRTAILDEEAQTGAVAAAEPPADGTLDGGEAAHKGPEHAGDPAQEA
jgi:trigger factor